MLRGVDCKTRNFVATLYNNIFLSYEAQMSMSVSFFSDTLRSFVCPVVGPWRMYGESSVVKTYITRHYAPLYVSIIVVYIWLGWFMIFAQDMWSIVRGCVRRRINLRIRRQDADIRS